MKRLIYFFIIILSFGCTPAKHISRVQTVTETVTKIDTVIIYKNDTVPKIETVYITDTAKTENNTALAKAYYSVKKQKIVLELKGKIFAVPVQAEVHSTISTNEKTKEVKESFSTWKFTGLFLIVLIIYLILDKLKK